jgi:transposase, IS5 family
VQLRLVEDPPATWTAAAALKGAVELASKRTWLYQRLRNFRAGIEGVVSFLKRCFGWDRCTWRSYDSFRAYAWSSVIAANLVMLARHSLS